MARSHNEESNDSTPPISVNRSTKIVTPISLILAFTASVVFAYAAWADQKSMNMQQEADIFVLKDRISRLEVSLAKIDIMQNDITWIRGVLERKYGFPKTDTNPGGH